MYKTSTFNKKNMYISSAKTLVDNQPQKLSGDFYQKISFWNIFYFGVHEVLFVKLPTFSIAKIERE